ncbi:MAG: ABC transporter ATP-binding protein [Planctomycetota bacterium]|nr:MAG: ABC transporter ATP-binding protein [Planctomycetota bacterium]
MQGLRRYLRLLAPYRTRYAFGLLLLLATNVLSLLVPWLIKGAVDALAAAGASGQASGDGALRASATPRPFAEPEHYALALVVTAVVLMLTRTASRVVVLGGARHLARDLKNRLYERLLAADPPFYARFNTGELMSRCVSDVRIAQAVAAPGILYTFNALFMFGIAVPYLLTLSPGLTGVLFLPYPFLAALTMWAATRVKGYARQAQEAMDELTGHLSETLSGMEVVKAFTLEEAQAERFARSNDTFLEKSMREAVARGGIGIAATLTGGVGACLLLWVGGGRVVRGELSYGEFALFFTVLAMVLRPVIYLGWVLSLFQRGLASVERLDELLEAPLAIRSPSEPRARGPVRGEVETRDLVYRYPALRGQQRRPALAGVTLHVPPGGTLGLTGRIGSGKSTLLRAVPRFIDAPPGSVLVDGVPVEEWELDALRAGMGYVPQDGAVFSLTLAENVAFGRPEASRAEVLEALRVAALDKDLDQLEDGLETVVGERGVTLSGGQRQRLAIARAVLVAPRILLLDDALSMVDAETAVAVLGNLRAALPEATVIIAAHRTATLLGCDELLVLDAGRVVERGAPVALLDDASSRFHAMHERQRLQAEILEEA